MRLSLAYGVSGTQLWRVDADASQSWLVRISRENNPAASFDAVQGSGIMQGPVPPQPGSYFLFLYSNDQLADTLTITVPQPEPQPQPAPPPPDSSGKFCTWLDANGHRYSIEKPGSVIKMDGGLAENQSGFIEPTNPLTGMDRCRRSSAGPGPAVAPELSSQDVRDIVTSQTADLRKSLVGTVAGYFRLGDRIDELAQAALDEAVLVKQQITDALSGVAGMISSAITGLRAELRGEIAALGASLSSAIVLITSELRGNIAEVVQAAEEEAQRVSTAMSKVDLDIRAWIEAEIVAILLRALDREAEGEK